LSKGKKGLKKKVVDPFSRKGEFMFRNGFHVWLNACRIRLVRHQSTEYLRHKKRRKDFGQSFTRIEYVRLPLDSRLVDLNPFVQKMPTIR